MKKAKYMIPVALMITFVAFALLAINAGAANDFTVYYNANGGSNAPRSTTVSIGETYAISKQSPKKKGYTFLGWGAKDSKEAVVSPGEKHTCDKPGSVTLYAVWKEGKVKTSYSTKAISNGMTYYIVPACAPSRTIDAKDASKKQETNIQIWYKNGGKNQKWKAIACKSGYYCFIDSNSNKALDINGGLALNRKNIALWTADKNDAQLFRLISAGDGYYYIQSKLNPAYCLDVYRGLDKNGTNVQLFQLNEGSINQKFKFVEAKEEQTEKEIPCAEDDFFIMGMNDLKTNDIVFLDTSISSSHKITWSSSNKAIATIASNGKVTAKKEGQTTITAKADDGRTRSLTVTVRKPEYCKTGRFDDGYVAQGYTTVTLNTNRPKAYFCITAYDLANKKTNAKIHVILRDTKGNLVSDFEATSGQKLTLGNDHSQYRVYIAQKQYPDTITGRSDEFINSGKCVYWSIVCKGNCYID